MPWRKSFIAKFHELKAERGKRALLPVPGATGLYIPATDRNGKAFTMIGRRKIGCEQVSANVPADDIGIGIDIEDDLDVIRAGAREGISRIKRGEQLDPQQRGKAPVRRQALQILDSPPHSDRHYID